MDGTRFDAIARKMADRKSRRSVVKAVGGAALGAAGVSMLASNSEVEAAARKRAEGAICSKNADCSSNTCGAADATGRRTCQPKPLCVNQGGKSGNADWSCPFGYRMPTTSEWDLVAPCITADDNARFGYLSDVAVSVGGCNCKWNSNWCGQPSIETIRGGRMCGDYPQLQICVSN